MAVSTPRTVLLLVLPRGRVNLQQSHLTCGQCTMRGRRLSTRLAAESARRGRGRHNLVHRFNSGSRLQSQTLTMPSKNGHFVGVFVFFAPVAVPRSRVCQAGQNNETLIKQNVDHPNNPGHELSESSNGRRCRLPLPEIGKRASWPSGRCSSTRGRCPPDRRVE